MLIASNYDGGYTQDAVEQAKLLLSSRYNSNEFNLKDKWEEETGLILEEDKGCSICRSPDVAYTENIYFCTEEIKDIDEDGEIVLPEFISKKYADFGVGVQHTHKNAGFRYIRGKFKLCQGCVHSRWNSKQGKPRINLGEYYAHPLYKYYEALGFCRIKLTLN